MSGIPSVKAALQNTPYIVSLLDDQGHVWRADEPLDIGGGNAGPSPERLMLASLGACTAITLKMVAARRNLPLTGLHVELQLNPNGKPAAGNDIVRTVHLQGELTTEQKEQLLKVANACPMHKLLIGEVRVNTSLTKDINQG